MLQFHLDLDAEIFFLAYLDSTHTIAPLQDYYFHILSVISNGAVVTRKVIFGSATSRKDLEAPVIPLRRICYARGSDITHTYSEPLYRILDNA